MDTAKSQTPNLDGAFSISSRRLDRGIALDLRGDVDIATAPIIEAELQRAEQSEDLIVLNLHGVEFMDSTGIRMVIAADRRVRERGGSLRIVRVRPQVQKLFKLVGVLDRLEIDGPVDAASDPAGRR